MKKILAVCLFLAASLFLFFNLRQILAAPPDEQYRFQDTQTIFGGGGGYNSQVIFKSNTPFKAGAPNRYSTLLFSPNQSGRPNYGNCYLPHMALIEFNDEGTEAKLVVEQLANPPQKVPSDCEQEIVNQFANQIIKIDSSSIKRDTPPPGGDLIPQRISVTVKVSTTGKGNRSAVPFEYQTDEVTIEGPKGQPNSKKETLQGAYTLTGKTSNPDDGYRLQYLAISDAEHPAPGTYTACSKVAQRCVDFEKQPTVRANVEIRNDSIVIEGIELDDPYANLPPPPPAPCPAESYDGEKCHAFNTGLGELSTNPGKFVSSIFGVLLALSGAIALILILRAGYKMMTSKGEPEKVKDAREQLIAAIVGLMFLIFSLVFLELIGFSILKLPGFTGSASAPPGTPPGGSNPDAPPVASECIEVYKLGSTNPCVKGLQYYLNIPITGIYDQATEDAVRKYQTENGLYPDGDAGPCTLGKLSGYTVDPICSGPLTEPVLRKFQEEKGLEVDGKFGKCTWQALMNQHIPDSCKA